MRFKQAGNKKDIIAVVVKSREATLTIPQGSPVLADPNGTNDGLAVILPESSAAARHDFFFGFATTDIAPGNFGEAQVFGFCTFARYLVATRLATSSVWASYVAGAIGDILQIDSLASDQCVKYSGAGSATNLFWAMVLAESYASGTTSASTLDGSLGGASSVATASIVVKKVMVRAL